MALEMDIRAVDIVMIFAVIVAPVAAVQVSMFIESRRERRRRLLGVFRTLMTTRALGTSAQHVEALNMIDVEFSRPNGEERRVRDTWKAYLDSLSNFIDGPAAAAQRQQIFVDLLHAMGTCLGYDLDKTHIKNSVYLPRAMTEAEAEQQESRRALNALLSGKISLPVHAVSPPSGPQSLPAEVAPPPAGKLGGSA
jgi:hypothetical protein